MSRLKNILKNPRVIILIVALILAILAISPLTRDGVAVRFVEKDSAAYLAGMRSPEKNSRPLDHEVIKEINGIPIENIADYFSALEGLQPNSTLLVRTDESAYTITVLPQIEYEVTGNIINETFETQEEIEVNGTLQNVTVNETRQVNETIENVVGIEDIGLTVYDAPNNNIRKGLDLQGGVRVLLQPDEPVSEDTLDRVKQNLDERLNAFGLQDIVIRKLSDFSGNNFIIVEIAGLQEKEIQSLIASQGKFEAKINDSVAFTGGDDVTYVCRSAQCSGIDPNRGCSITQEGNYACNFFFTISLSSQAAQNQADLTRDLNVITENNQQYLDQNLDLYLDDQLVDTLRIGASLKGRAETQISISGSGAGTTRQEAMTDALSNMKQLQTILETGSLPVKLNVVKADSLSPVLGQEFLRNALITGLTAILAVGVVVFLRYRTLKISIPMLLINFSEIILLLGLAALFGTNMDLAAIAGIIIVIGTGVDHQIVISDELLNKETEVGGWKGKMKSAFFIIMAAYLTTMVAMIPLWFAGAQILKGFALTTIMGVSIGVFITRPAFGAMVENLTKK